MQAFQTELGAGSYNERMRSPLAKLRWVAAPLLLALAALWGGSRGVTAAQTQQPFPATPSPSSANAPFGAEPDPNDPMQRQREQKMEKARNVARQQDLVRDTDKLLALAKELKEEVNQSNKDTLSVEVVKKAAEIERLAKSVKDRMRG